LLTIIPFTITVSIRVRSLPFSSFVFIDTSRRSFKTEIDCISESAMRDYKLAAGQLSRCKSRGATRPGEKEKERRGDKQMATRRVLPTGESLNNSQVLSRLDGGETASYTR
jgi:hypothetical protein